MARLEPLKRDELSEHEELFALVEAFLGFVPNSMLTMARRPDIMVAFATLAGAINGPGAIEPGLKRLISEVASKAAGCQYCVAHTSFTAHRDGVAQEKLDDIWTFETSPLYSAAERAALTIAMKGAQVPNLAEDEDFDRLRQFFDDDQIVEIISVIALFGFLNRWNDTLATPLEAEPLDYATATNPGRAWSAGEHA